MSYRNTIENYAVTLGVDESLYTNCPSCHGHDKLSVTRNNEGVLYHCFRASCELKGFIPDDGVTAVPRTQRVFVPKTLRVPLTPLSVQARSMFWRKFELSYRDMPTVRLSGNRIAFPIKGPWGQHRGYVLRAYEELTGPLTGSKSLSLPAVPGVFLGWWKNTYRTLTDDLVLVEDAVSAIKLATMTNAVSLQGTEISSAAALEIADTKSLLGYERVTIALDPDATSKAYKLLDKYQLLWQNARVVVLDADPKDTPMDELEDIFSG